MTKYATALPSIGAYKSHAMIENEILEMFAPVHQHCQDIRAQSRIDRSLWRADAIHRAKNLAQLTLSLATLAEHPSRCWLPNGLVVETRRLAHAYAELGEACGHNADVPCAPLLQDIVTRLALIFGGARRITLSVEAEPVMLAPDMRRVLILICSELVINALKYAYPGDGGGDIRVMLMTRDAVMLLVVEDDGVGLKANIAHGQGDRLLDELAAVCGATVHHGPGRGGKGCRVTAQLPALAVTALALQA